MSAVGPEGENEVTLSLHNGSNMFTASFMFLLLFIFIVDVAFTFFDVAVVEVTVFFFMSLSCLSSHRFACPLMLVIRSITTRPKCACDPAGRAWRLRADGQTSRW